jgi:hypothetical protein
MLTKIRLLLSAVLFGWSAFGVEAQTVNTPGYMSGYSSQPSPVCGVQGCSQNSVNLPAITGTCLTAGGGTSAVSAGSNAFAGRITCTSTANTTATITWATAKLAVPFCVVTAETATAAPILTITPLAASLSWTYASTVSPIFDYICIGQ